MFGRIVARFVEEHDPSRKCPGALSSPASVRARHAREHFIGTITNHLRGHAGNELHSPAGSRGTLFRFFGAVAIWYFYMCRKAHWILAISSPRLARPSLPVRSRDRKRYGNKVGEETKPVGRDSQFSRGWMRKRKRSEYGARARAGIPCR